MSGREKKFLDRGWVAKIGADARTGGPEASNVVNGRTDLVGHCAIATRRSDRNADREEDAVDIVYNVGGMV